MYDRADSHAHLFKPGWVGGLPESCRHVQPDEVTLYESVAAQHRVKHLLAVGYAAEAWCCDNNAYLAQIATERPLVRPVAYFDSPADLSIDALERLARQKFVGISLYLFRKERTDALTAMPKQIWDWLIARRW